MDAIHPEYVAGEILKELNAPAWISAETWPLFLTRKQKIENMGAMSLQNHEEFAGLIDMLRSQPIRNVCEIGNGDGFWLGVLATAIGRPLNILAIDPDPNSFPHPDDCPENYPRKFKEIRGYLKSRGHIVVHYDTKSQSDKAQEGMEIFTGLYGPLDVLHIDGDHTYEGCLADWDLYSGYVRPGGFIILHDVYNDMEPGVQKVWEMAKKSGQVWKALKICREKATPKPRGIGVIRKWLTDSTA
jgi:predicted O-methyltransferase YrrM